MNIVCSIPASLRDYTSNKKTFKIKADTIKRMIFKINENHPGFKDQVMDETDTLRRFLNIYINDEDIRFIDGENTQLRDGDKVHIITAVAGG